jgi:hypothetical protein
MDRNPLDEVTHVLKDAAYVSVGLGVIAFQRLQVRRNELTKALGAPGESASSAIDLVGNLVGDRLKAVEERIGAVLERR